MEFEFLFPFVSLYAETHFRFFRLFPSALYRRRPEVVFDIPFRIESKLLPLCLTIHDIGSYSTDLKKVTATISSAGKTFTVADITQCEGYRLTHGLSKNTEGYLFPVPLPQEIEPGPFYVNAFADLTSKGKTGSWKVFNDNLPTSSKRALAGRYSAEKFPGSERSLFGDIHLHSQYSESHVEFGPPIEMISRAGGAAGLDFVGITDHSYDLACAVDNYLLADPNVQRWELLKKESRKQYSDAAAVLWGEEVSTLNSRGKVVHLGGLAFSDFIPGSLDGARRNRKRDKQLNTHEVAAEISRQGGISFAAHPGARPGILQKILLGRSTWNEADLSPHLHAFQGANGDFDVAWERSRRLWIQALLRGHRLCLVAGSDAHGDFSRYRSVGIPFVSVSESFSRHMGYTRTGVYTSNRNKRNILDCIRTGKTFVTSGPYLSINKNGTSVVGECFSQPPGNLSVTVSGSKEFGTPVRLRVYRGVCGAGNERVLAEHVWDETKLTREVSLDFATAWEHSGYIRAEAVSRESTGNTYKAYTSAVFFNPDDRAP